MSLVDSDKTIKRVLVTDDESDVRHVIRRILESEGYQVAEAENGEQCIQALRKDADFDLVILDIIMPGQEGIETLRIIRQELPAMKLLMVSGGGRIHSGQYLSMAKSLGANDVLAKPFDSRQLLNIVDGILGS